jgi:biopolymer transport protein TolR
MAHAHNHFGAEKVVRGETPHASADMNVTPLIDVLLVLLIIFMAAIPEQRRALAAQLPQDERSATNEHVPIVLEVGSGARYRINQQPVLSGQLANELRAIYQGRSDKTLIVRGDRSARYQEVITAIDLARGAGVTVVGVDTRQ